MTHSAEITEYVKKHFESMHPFKLWLFYKKKRLIDVAATLGVTSTYLTYIFRGIRYPSPELAMKIEDLTCGEIKAFDIVAPPNKF